MNIKGILIGFLRVWKFYPKGERSGKKEVFFLGVIKARFIAADNKNGEEGNGFLKMRIRGWMELV